jgi:hypothetical protein
MPQNGYSVMPLRASLAMPARGCNLYTLKPSNAPPWDLDQSLRQCIVTDERPEIMFHGHFSLGITCSLPHDVWWNCIGSPCYCR